MSNRLNQEREKRLTPIRLKSVFEKLEALGMKPEAVSETEVNFMFKDELVKFFPYSGWATGKSIEDGRGFNKLLKQLKQ